jgi:4-amino-4-deoxy-L-arabinose transferase-like glycosyltransferase
MLTIIAVFAIADRSFGRSAALLAALLLATNPVQVEYSAHLLPDIVVSGFMLASAALLYEGREARGAGRPWLLGGLCVVALLLGALTKETAVWVTPFFLGVLFVDLARRRNLRLWTAIVATGVGGLALFLLAYRLATGDPLHILDVMERTHNVSEQASFVGKSSEEYAHRLTLAPVEFLAEQLGYGHLAFLALPALIHLVWPLRRMAPGARFWAAYALVLLLCFWFGSTSLRSYNPLPISARFLMPRLSPPPPSRDSRDLRVS